MLLIEVYDGQDVALKMYQGDNLDFTLAYVKENGEPINITSYKAVFEVKQTADAVDSVIRATELDYITIDGPAGSVTVSIPTEVMDDLVLDGNKGVYDLRINSPVGDVTTLIYGQAFVQPRVAQFV